MTPFRTFLAILSIFLLLGALSVVFPADGIPLGSFTLRFPSILEKLNEEVAAQEDSLKPDPEAQIQQMLAETRAKELAEFADTLAFYESFFREGQTRFDFPKDDPTWFDGFFELAEAAKDSGDVIRIVHYGDSQLEGDRITSTLREFLQQLFGGTGPGMVPPLADIPSFVFNSHSVGNLSRHRIFGPAEEHAHHNRYGPLAQVTDLRGKATFTFKKSLHQKQFPTAGRFQKIRLLADKPNLKIRLVYSAAVTDTILHDSLPPEFHERKQKFLAADPSIDTLPGLSVYSWELQHETESLTLTVSGRAGLYSILLDGTSGVAVDNVAMRGSSGTIFAKMDNALLGTSLNAIRTKLVILEYGGNLVPSVTKSNLDWVDKILERQIQAIRNAVPDAKILFIGPADMSKKIGGKWRSYPSLKMTIEKIREVALRNGCAYWDMYRVMGGEGSMIAWVKEKPPLGGPDYIHFTRAGAAHIGELLYNAIKLHYDHYLFRKLHGIDLGKLRDIHTFADSVRAADTLISQSDTLFLQPMQELSVSDSSETEFPELGQDSSPENPDELLPETP